MADPRVFYIPRYASATPICRVDRPKAGYFYDLVFVGSDMFQNARGLLTFSRQQRHGSRHCDRSGRSGRRNTSVRAFAQDRPHIHLLGFVDDLFATYAASKAAISPVDGTGLKIKVVEALGHGRPVFASRQSGKGWRRDMIAAFFLLSVPLSNGYCGIIQSSKPPPKRTPLLTGKASQRPAI